MIHLGVLPTDMIAHIVNPTLKSPAASGGTRGVPCLCVPGIIVPFTIFGIGRPVFTALHPASVRLRMRLIVFSGVAPPFVARVGAPRLGTCPCAVRILDGLRGGGGRGGWLQRSGGLWDLTT